MLENILTTGQQVLVLVVLLLVGFVCGKVRLFSDESISHLSAFVLKIVTPSAIIQSFCRPFDARMFQAMGQVLLLSLGVHCLCVLFATVFFRRGEVSTLRVQRYGVVFANCGYMGLPLQQVLFGSDGVFFGATWIIIFQLFSWTYGLVAMSGNRKEISLKKLLTSPGLIGVAVGLVVFLCSLELPAIISAPLSYISQLNVSVPMVISGYYLAKVDMRTVWRQWGYYKVCALRLVVIPLVAIGLMSLLQQVLPLDGTMLASCVVDVAAPVAAATTMFATLYHQDSKTAANLVSISTILSVLTLPVMLALGRSVFM